MLFFLLQTTVDAILEDVLEALNNKNPSVKSETALFLSRSFTKTLSTSLNKKLLKALTGGLLKIVNEPGKHTHNILNYLIYLNSNLQ